jgi:acyl-coenzyme A synthetase/AMP-(fatty) acid ligase/3-hydroxymyristoyl/3-hydroxydecanoyl-(acyl carrier protein) dehydratase
MVEWLSLAEVASAPGLADRPVALRGGVCIGRTRFLADVAAWRASFAAHTGRRFALYFDDACAFTAALFGAWHAGKAVYLPGDAQPATVERLLTQVDGCAGLLPGALTMAEEQPDRAGTPQPVALDAQGSSLVIYTSGSSGEPSAIAKTLAQLDAEVHTLQAAFGARVDGAGAATVLSTVSHQHIYGLLFAVLWPLAAGRPFVATRLQYPEEIAACGLSPCVLITSPAHLRRLSDTIDWRGARAAMQAVFAAGEPLPTEAATTTLTLLGQSPIEVYGTSETGGIAWRQQALHSGYWQAMPGVQWRIEEEEGEGLLAVRSPHLADDAWYTTPDRAEALSVDRFMLRGRADRIAKIEGKRVSLTAMERLLAACDEIKEARVLLLSRPEGATERLAVAAVLTPAGRALLQAGRRVLNERLRTALLHGVERVALPRRWRYVQAWPINAQGKVTQAALEALFRPARPVAQWRSRDTQTACAALDIDAGLAVFDGHFPGDPILPGVAQIDWAVEFARECFTLPPHFLRLEALKFQRPLRPGMQVELALQWQPAAGVLAFRYTSSAGMHAGGRVVFEAGA